MTNIPPPPPPPGAAPIPGNKAMEEADLYKVSPRPPATARANGTSEDFVPAPCPHCGETFIPFRNDQGKIIFWAHPTYKNTSVAAKDRCYLVGNTFGDAIIERWSRRAFCYEVNEDNIPTFNNQNKGVPVTPEFLNACFEYLSEQGLWPPK